MRFSNSLVTLSLLAVVVLGSAAVANALTLTLSVTGGPSVTVVDQGAGDINPTVGAVTFSGGLGTFTVNVTTGISQPVLAPVEMDLNSVNVAGGAGTITITLSDNFLLPTGTNALNSTIGGTFSASATSTLNASQCVGAVCATHPAFGPGAFSGTAGAIFTTTTGVPFTLTENVVINFVGGGGNVSFDLNSKVPEPSVLMLLGTSLVSMAAVPAVSRRWRARRESK